jgi:DNA-binding winged helix-turn-helix (wHTH) protein/tetratricopeptide (TPR) repeat protein
MDRPRTWQTQRIDLAVEPVLRVGGATIDPVSREATFAGGRERLQPQNLKVLIALARRKGKVVTRSDLIDLCWDGRIVGEDVINHSISLLRAFAARATGFAIETVPKAGYRLTETRGASGWRNRLNSKTGWAAALTVAVGAALLVARPAEKQGEPPVPTVGIAPFGVPAGDAAAAEVARAARLSLSHMLSEGGFPVRLVDTGDKRADFVISGDVKHASGKIEAMVRLEETRQHVVIFSRRFEGPEHEAANLPDQIGASLATNLSWTAALMILDRRNPMDPRVTGELLKQMSLVVEGGDILRVYEISRRVVEQAPNSAIAQISLAFASGFVLGELPRDQRAAAVTLGRRAADRARALAPEFGDVYIPWCLLHSWARRAECERWLRHGMKADPNAPFAAAFLGGLLHEAGRFDESMEFARIAIANDPYKPAKLANLIRMLEVTGRAAEADDVYARANRWWPNERRIYWARLMGFIEHGDFDAIERFAQNRPELGPATEAIAALRSRDASRARLACGRDSPEGPTQSLCLVILAQLGELDAAYAKADRMFPRMVGRNPEEEEKLWLDNPGGYSETILSTPTAAVLRRDPRYIELVRRTGLLDYWRSSRLPDFCRKAPEPVCSRIRK